MFVDHQFSFYIVSFFPGAGKLILLLIFVFIFTMSNSAFCESNNQDSHWEFWPSASIEKKIDDKNKGRFTVGLRYNKGVNYQQKLDLRLCRPVNPKMEYGYGYSYVRNLSDNKWTPEHRPYYYYTPKWKIRKFRFSNRMMLEYRLFIRDNRSYARFRNKLTIAFPIKLKRLGLEFSPYIADEIFIFPDDNNIMKVGRNRGFIGIKHDFCESAQIDFHYMRQLSGNILDKGSDKDIFSTTGLEVKFRF